MAVFQKVFHVIEIIFQAFFKFYLFLADLNKLLCDWKCSFFFLGTENDKVFQ